MARAAHPSTSSHERLLVALTDELTVLEAEAHYHELAAKAPRRELFPWEQVVDFATIVSEVDTLSDRIVNRTRAAREALAEELEGALTMARDEGYSSWHYGRTVTGHEAVIGRLADLSNPAAVNTIGAGITARLVDDVRTELAAAASAGYASTLGEAARQGVPARLLGTDVDLDALEPELDRSAIRIGRQPVERGLQAAARIPFERPVFTMSTDELIGEARGSVEALTDPQDADVARQEAHKLHGLARQQAAERLPTATVIYASELMDRNTCGPCSMVDGREYASLAGARLDYPEGRYRSCQGGPRCRGTLVFVWPSEAEPTVVDGDGPPPAAPNPNLPTPEPGELAPDPGAAWQERLSRLRAQRPAKWAELDTPFDDTAFDAAFRARNGRGPTRAEYLAARQAHEAANFTQAAAHEVMVRQAGAVIREEVARRLSALTLDRAPLEAAKAALREAEEAYRAASEVYRPFLRNIAPRPGTPEREAYEAARAANDAARKRLHAARAEVEEAEGALRLAPGKVYREVLSEVQEMGAGGLRHKYAGGDVVAKGTKPLEAALDNMPRRWVQASVDHSVNEYPLLVGHIKRGHYLERDVRTYKGRPQRVARLNLSYDDPYNLFRVATHEFGHRVEHVVDGIRRLEHAFYKRRTTRPDGTQEPKKWIGRGRRDEMTREDDFVDNYMGKDYGAGPDDFYELLATGNEAVFTGRYGALAEDEDMLDFILGLFVMV